MAPTYRITTLGCRVNHAESRELETILLARGLRRASGREGADLEVVHSCSVTNAAAAKSRAALRRAARRLAATPPSPPSGVLPHADRVPFDAAAPPSPAVIVTGCYAETHDDEAARLTGDDRRVIPHEPDQGASGSMVERFANEVDRWLARRAAGAQTSVRGAGTGSSAAAGTRGDLVPLPVIPPAPTAGVHQRAELRIQDGCDAHCTFCVIPSIRRTLRSKTPADAVREARMLVDLGHREIVLTGVFIGAYGHETALRRRQRRPDAEPLADLLDAVARVPGLDRVRLSSMEPGDVTGALLDAMVANRPVVVPHLHLPLQSGSDRVLRRMNRQYGVDDYLEMIEMVNAALTEECLPPAITTDVICGFPGETDDDFERTVAVARRVGYLHMHVFPFSPKLGTAAARWRDAFVDERTKRDRVRRLIALEEHADEGLSIRFRRQLLGRTVRAIVEQPDRTNRGWTTGRCDHYALVHLAPRDGAALPRGRTVQARITAVTAERTIGRVVATDVSLPMATA